MKFLSMAEIRLLSEANDMKISIEINQKGKTNFIKFYKRIQTEYGARIKSKKIELSADAIAIYTVEQLASEIAAFLFVT